jgi:hypothetical protein
MYNSFEVKNFRCFRQIALAPLERINLVTGRNNTGKTALLEALFLSAGPGNPDLARRVNQFRGADVTVGNVSDWWEWLFWDTRIRKPIEIIVQLEDGSSRELVIRCKKPGETRYVPAGDEEPERERPLSMVTEPKLAELAFELHDSAGRRFESRAVQHPGGMSVQPATVPGVPVSAFMSTRQRFPREDVQRFSELAVEQQEKQVLTALKPLEPRLRSLRVLLRSGQAEPQIYGDIGLRQLVPWSLMGEGTERMLRLVVTIANFSGGIVLVDEIENGFHYSALPHVWEAVARIARSAKTQVFATTHSRECIQAAHRVFTKSRAYDFRLHRLERIDGTIRSVTYDEEKLDAALATGLEIR